MDRASAVLDDFLQPLRQCLTPEQARKLAEFKVGPDIQAVLDEFARKSDDGTLTKEERDEYEALVEAGDMIAFLQATAREVLDSSEAA